MAPYPRKVVQKHQLLRHFHLHDVFGLLPRSLHQLLELLHSHSLPSSNLPNALIHLVHWKGCNS